MTAPAWAGWMAVTLLERAALKTEARDPASLVTALRGRRLVFDGHKGMPLTFRPADQQLRQPLYVMRVREGRLTEHSEAPRVPGRLNALGASRGPGGCDVAPEVWTRSGDAG